jgi:F-type H+-transporting ATPase subunit b
MPQIAQIAATYASQAFWLLVVFAIIYFVIARGAVTKVGATVDARAAKIADDLAAAQTARDVAAASDSDYDLRNAASRAEATKLIAAAKTKATTDAAKKVAKVDAELDAKVEAAAAAVAQSAAAAMADVKDAATDAAADIVTRLTGASPDRKALAAAVTANMR